jgi:rubredoxin
MADPWICPICRHVYAPFVPECPRCPAQIVTFGFDNSTSVCPNCGQHASATPTSGCPSGSHDGTYVNS